MQTGRIRGVRWLRLLALFFTCCVLMQSIPTLDQEPVATKAKEGIRDDLSKVTNPETQTGARQKGQADYSVN